MIQKLEHETWRIHDASKIKAYKTCPRKYFYEYVLGWRYDKPNHDLIFGESWHNAMAHLLLAGYDKVEEAHNSHFIPKYRETFSIETDLDFAPKNPGFALDALVQYARRYAPEDTFKVHHVEVYGTVDTGRHKLHFRMDSVCEDSRGVFCLEHKTTKMDIATWDAEWALSTQTNLYNHVLLCMFGFDHTFGTVVSGTIFRKGGIGFKRVDVRPDKKMMYTWLHDTNKIMDKIKNDYEIMLAPDATDLNYMPCFYRNEEACMKYMKVCPYHAFCTAWPNPLQRCEDLPMGFSVQRWNPADAAVESGKELMEV